MDDRRRVRIGSGNSGFDSAEMVVTMRCSEKKLKTGHTTSDFVADGYERAIAAIESEVRSQVEQKYADEWNASRLVKRWFMLRMIDREIADGVAERSEQISPDSMF